MSDPLIGQRVAVYRNLTRKCFSVQVKGLVIARRNEVHLENVSFRVSQKGREKVLKEKRKNVHARIYGILVESVVVEGREVYYNPYTTETFVVGSEAIYEASACVLRDGKVYV